jgi:hypothetical protein
VKPVAETPTEPLDYAVLSAAYGSLLGALVLAARAGRVDDDPITGAELIPMAAATFALSKTLVHEKVESWVRAPFVAEGDGGERRPKGRRLRYAVGELMSCTRCTGTWSALAVVGLRATSPPAGRVVTAVLATSAANDFLHGCFTLVSGKANQAQG